MANDWIFSKLKTILIAGYYGFGNTGDEVILESILNNLRNEIENVQIIVISGNVEDTQNMHNVTAVSWIDIGKVVECCSQCDLVILGGGGIFHDYLNNDPNTLLTSNYSGISFYATFPILAYLLGKPLIIYAVGVGPLFSDESKKLTFSSFELATISSVRDIESKKELSKLGINNKKIQVTTDPAFELAIPSDFSKELRSSIEKTKKGKFLVGVSLREWNVGVQTHEWIKNVASALDQIIEQYDADVIFLPFQRLGEDKMDDYAVSQDTINIMKNKERTSVLNKKYSPSEMEGIISCCDILIGMRLHSVILGAKASVPVIGIVYDSKVRNIMKQLKCEEYALDLSSLETNNLFNLFAKALGKRQEIKSLLTANSNILATISKKNHDLVRKVMNKEVDLDRKITVDTMQIFKKILLTQVISLYEKDLKILKMVKDVEILQTNNIKNQKLINQVSQTISNLTSQNNDLLAKFTSLEKVNLERESHASIR